MPAIRINRLIPVVAVALLFAVVAACSTGPATLDQQTANAKGARLANEYYDTPDCEGKDLDRCTALLHDPFQSVTATGSKTKSQVLDVIGSICFEDLQVSDITTTAAPGVLIVSYRASISRNGVPGTPTERVNVFVDKDGT